MQAQNWQWVTCWRCPEVDGFPTSEQPSLQILWHGEDNALLLGQAGISRKQGRSHDFRFFLFPSRHRAASLGRKEIQVHQRDMANSKANVATALQTFRMVKTNFLENLLPVSLPQRSIYRLRLLILDRLLLAIYLRFNFLPERCKDAGHFS